MTAKICMLHWMSGLTVKIQLEINALESLKIALIEDKLREIRLRRFGDVSKRSNTAPVRRAEKLWIEGIKRRGRPSKIWKKEIKKNMLDCGVISGTVYDRVNWRRITHKGDSRQMRLLVADDDYDDGDETTISRVQILSNTYKEFFAGPTIKVHNT